MRHDFFLKNYTSNPTLFCEEDINRMGMLGHWSWQQFCLKLNNDFCDLKRDSFHLVQTNNLLSTKLNESINKFNIQESMFQQLNERITRLEKISLENNMMLRSICSQQSIDVPQQAQQEQIIHEVRQVRQLCNEQQECKLQLSFILK